VSLLSEGVPPLRSSSERRDALRRFLGEGSPALREDLQAVGDPVWPPPLVGLVQKEKKFKKIKKKKI
jgi:hypothetical protein